MAGLVLSVLGLIGLVVLVFGFPLGVPLWWAYWLAVLPLLSSVAGTLLSAVSLSRARPAPGSGLAGAGLLDPGLWGLGIGLVVSFQLWTSLLVSLPAGWPIE